MKILHFADLHLGVESYGHLDPATGLSSRLLDFLTALDRVVDCALEEGVDLVLFCGDAYRSREPTQTQQREFARRLNRLSSSGIPVFLLVGNHDLPNATFRATTTEIFDTLAVQNVYVSSRPQLYRIPTKGGILQVASLPWLRRNALLTREECKNLSLEQLNQKLQQVLTQAVTEGAQKIDPALPAVLAAHVWVAGARVGSEKSMVIGQEPALLLSNVTHPAFDYVALGHIHRRQVLHTSPPVVYPGSLERLDFSEEKDDKGFYLVEIDPARKPGDRVVSFDFRRLEGRRFVSIEVDIGAEDDDPTAAVLSKVDECGEALKDAVLRLNISVPAELEPRLRDSDIRQEVRAAHYLIISKNIRRDARPRLGGWTAEDITPQDALKKWLETQGLSADRGRLVLEYGQRLIEEGDKGA